MELDKLKKELYGATEEGVCIRCKKPPRFKTEAGKREYQISGMCEYCFDELFEELE